MTATRPADVEPPHPQRRRRQASPLSVIGVLLLAAGLACIGWVVYQYLGTNVVSNRAFTQETGGLRAQWEVPSSATPKADSSIRPTAIPGEAIALLRIPKFGRDYEVPILEGVDLKDLARGVGHYSSTAQAGQVGNFAIAGHRITHGQPFSKLETLDKGDTVVVETREAIYTYVVDTPPRELTVKETAGWVLEPVPDQPDATPTRALITLTTCQDLFHSPDRSVGFGHLDTTQNK